VNVIATTPEPPTAPVMPGPADAADTPPHVFLNQRVLPVALVDELPERLDVVLLRRIDRGEPTGHRLDALAITVEHQCFRSLRPMPAATSSTNACISVFRL